MLNYLYLLIGIGIFYLFYKLIKQFSNTPHKSHDGSTDINISILKINNEFVTLNDKVENLICKLRQSINYEYSFSNFEPNFTELSGNFKLLHFYQNGSIGTEIEVKPAKTITKTKHGVTRTIAGGAIGGVPGAAVGLATAKKESTTKPPLTTTSRSPKNALLVFQNIDTEKRLTIECNLDFESQLINLKKFIHKNSEFSE